MAIEIFKKLFFDSAYQAHTWKVETDVWLCCHRLVLLLLFNSLRGAVPANIGGEQERALSCHGLTEVLVPLSGVKQVKELSVGLQLPGCPAPDLGALHCRPPIRHLAGGASCPLPGPCMWARWGAFSRASTHASRIPTRRRTRRRLGWSPLITPTDNTPIKGSAEPGMSQGEGQTSLQLGH